MVGWILPRTEEELAKCWFRRKLVLRGGHVCTVVWPGTPLPIRGRQAIIKRHISAEHVFIGNLGTLDRHAPTSYVHFYVDVDDVAHVIPRKYYPICFRSVNVNHVPAGNMVRIEVLQDESEWLPFIPDSFYRQKESKSKRDMSSKQRRQQGRASESAIVADGVYDHSNRHMECGWVEQPPPPQRVLSKEDILQYIHTLVRHMDGAEAPWNPFESVASRKDLEHNAFALHALHLVSAFVYHYARDEFGLRQPAGMVHDQCVRKMLGMTRQAHVDTASAPAP